MLISRYRTFSSSQVITNFSAIEIAIVFIFNIYGLDQILSYNLPLLHSWSKTESVINVHANHARTWPISSRPLWGHDGLGLSYHSVVFTRKSIISNQTLHILVYNISHGPIIT